MNKEPKYLINFFAVKSPHSWHLIPSIKFYYRKDAFFATGEYSPAYSVSFKWLRYIIAVRVQRNLYY